MKTFYKYNSERGIPLVSAFNQRGRGRDRDTRDDEANESRIATCRY